jgi:DNA mismatch repair protein MutH
LRVLATLFIENEARGTFLLPHEPGETSPWLYQDLPEVKKVYERTVDILREGVKIEEQLTKKGIVRKNNLPSMKENPVCHVRPHGRNAEDVYEVPDGRWMTKQCFWLNSSYVYSQIESLI